MTTLTIMRGLPGSGKTTKARTLRADEIVTTLIVSRDALRVALTGSKTAWRTLIDDQGRSDLEKVVERISRHATAEFLKTGVNVIVDDQNLNPASLSALIMIARERHATVTIIDCVIPTINKAMERNHARPADDRVPDDYLRAQWARWIDPATGRPTTTPETIGDITPSPRDHPVDKPGTTTGTLLERMRAARTVVVKPVRGETGIWACNFTRSAFTHGDWDEYSSRARGLFLADDGTVVMRGFDKFFNIGENDATTMTAVRSRMTYPARVEDKKNGFLGLVGAAPEEDRLRYWSKSGETDYTALVRRGVCRSLERSGVTVHDLWSILHDANATLACEVVDMTADRHIIRYDASTCWFLHAIRNAPTFSLDDDAENRIREITSESLWPSYEVIDDINGLDDAIRAARTTDREGVVIYGHDGYMVKVKSDHYLRTKSLRTPLKRVLLHGDPVPADASTRSHLIREVIERSDRDHLVYRRDRFGIDDDCRPVIVPGGGDLDVDMTSVGEIVRAIESEEELPAPFTIPEE